MKKATLPEPRKARGTLEGYYRKLEKLGYKEIGSGAFSTVYGNGDVVIKVAEGGDGYDAFLEYALAYQNNPYFPKIYAVERYTNVKWNRKSKSGSEYTVVTMERLDGEAPPGISRSLHTRTSEVKSKQFTSDNPKEKQALRVLAELEKEHGWLDMHSGNVMMRGKQPVIIDPVAG